jgi:hypothetical protein
MPTAQ